MLVYDTTSSSFYYHDGGKWQPISQPNSDSLLRYSYPGVAPTIASLQIAGTTYTNAKFGTLYDNGGPSGNYSNNITNGSYAITRVFDSTVFVKVEVEEMNLESPYDSLIIYSDIYNDKKEVFTGNRTGTFYFRGDENVVFKFNSNGVNNLSGFKINWTRITTNSQKVDGAPLTGFYFNSQQLAARIGVNFNDNWATNNLGKYSFSSGQNSVAKGEYSTAIGRNNFAIGDYSTALGLANTASGTASTAIGNSNNVSGFSATAIGYFLIAKSSTSTVLGQFNDTSNIDRIFEIGNGDGFNYRSNAVTVLYNGNTGIGTTTPVTQLEVNGGIKTKYSGSAIVSVTGTGSAALVYVPITTLPAGWDFTNTLVLVSVADGITGVIYRTKLVTTSAIELVFEANATGPTRFNYIVFKL
jgi:hypothetical protein